MLMITDKPSKDWCMMREKIFINQVDYCQKHI